MIFVNLKGIRRWTNNRVGKLDMTTLQQPISKYEKEESQAKGKTGQKQN
jgi:hypothetical protein